MLLLYACIIESRKFSDPAYIKYYIRSFLGALPYVVEQYFKDKNITLEGMSLAMVDHHIKIIIQEHCMEKGVTKYFKRYDNIFTSSLCKDVGHIPEWGCGAHNRAHDSKNIHCCCKSKGKKFHSFRSRFNLDYSWPKNKNHKYKYFKNIPYLKKRHKPTEESTCFNCKEKGHWAQ
jgi:hypothetical protein